MQIKLASIPTNIITGFLGAGKTTAILSLLKRKPSNQRWAVLVNEFGNIGIDGTQMRQVDGVYLKELPGGCMCCTASVPMQTALNVLLREARPDRLLIEPTGLGHPKQLLDLLTSTFYKTVLDMRATITLVDARNTQQPRYTGNDIFNQQLQTADMIIANKADLYDAHDLAALNRYLAAQPWFSNQPVAALSQGEIPLSWLDKPTGISIAPSPLSQRSVLNIDQAFIETENVTQTEIKHSRNQQDGYSAEGWIFGTEYCFEHQQIYDLFASLQVERLKAICLTEQGTMLYQKVADNNLHCELIGTATASRISIISIDSLAENMTQQLHACLNSSHVNRI